MENTRQNKAKFFAQYWGQNILFQNEGLGVKRCIQAYWERTLSSRYIEVIPISQITEEHALKVAAIFDLEEDQIKNTDLPEWIEALFEEAAGYYIDGYRGDQLLQAIDFLRSNGYALKWEDLTVAAQIEYGWIKLKDIE